MLPSPVLPCLPRRLPACCLAVASTIALLSACGGGGGGDAPQVQAPVVVASPGSPDRLPQLAQIVHMGQSLGQGAEAFPVITVADTGLGNLQFARGVVTWREHETAYCRAPQTRPDSDFALTAIAGGDAASGSGETIASGLADGFKSRLPGVDTRFLVTYAGQGGRRLRDLDKRHADASDPRSARPTAGGHYLTSIDDVRRARTQATGRGWSHRVVALTWMQGEAENDYKVNDWTAPLPYAQLIDTYATDLINLKNDWNADIGAITGQSGRIPMFVYQTYGAVTGQAQLLATDRDPDIMMVAPTYMMATSLDSAQPHPGAPWGSWIHLAADGERWLGEQFAKVMHRTLVEKKPWQPLRPLSAWKSGDGLTVFVRYAVPAPPLVLDTQFLPAVDGFGFALAGGPAIASAAVVAPDVLALTLAQPLASDVTATLQYAADERASKVLDMPVPVKTVRAAPAWANGQASFEVVYAGDWRTHLAATVRAGAFYLMNDQGQHGAAKAVIRAVDLDADGNTVLRGETRELAGGVPFAAGQATRLHLPRFVGNVRDSDASASLYRFAHGPRKGEPYPLWNWSVAYRDLPIKSAP